MAMVLVVEPNHSSQGEDELVVGLKPLCSRCGGGQHHRGQKQQKCPVADAMSQM